MCDCAQLKSEVDVLQLLVNACMLEARQKQTHSQSEQDSEADREAAERRIGALEAEKAEAVRLENYSAAKALKTEVDHLRARLAAREPLPAARVVR